MPSINDYLQWRGDLSLAQDPWNDVDSLLMAALGYVKLDETVKGECHVSLADLIPLVDAHAGEFFNHIAMSRKLFVEAARSERYGSIVLHDYEDILNEEETTQFAAVAADLPDGTMFVIFRGTDATIVGWREDFNMSYESPVPAQELAVAYLERVTAATNRKVLVGGHSKGGNLAAYAAAHVSEKSQTQIQSVYSFDGPGLDDETMSQAGYARILPKLRSIIPQGSVVGLLMGYHTDYRVIKSEAFPGLRQHDLYTWQVMGRDFVSGGELLPSSRLMDETLHEWLKCVTVEERKAFVDTIFDLVSAGNARTLADLTEDKLKTAALLLRETRKLSGESRAMLLKLMKRFLTLGVENVKTMVSEKNNQHDEKLVHSLETKHEG